MNRNLAGKENIAFIVMGVSGSGKSSVGICLAQTLGCPFIDADDFHPLENIQAMERGQALNEEMRAPWLCAVAKETEERRQSDSIVLACSALKKSHRDLFRAGISNLKFIHLNADFEVIKERLLQRKGHFMSPSLLKSQFEVLEKPSDDEQAIHVDVSAQKEKIVGNILSFLKEGEEKEENVTKSQKSISF